MCLGQANWLWQNRNNIIRFLGHETVTGLDCMFEKFRRTDQFGVTTSQINFSYKMSIRIWLNLISYRFWTREDHWVLTHVWENSTNLSIWVLKALAQMGHYGSSYFYLKYRSYDFWLNLILYLFQSLEDHCDESRVPEN